MLNMQPTYRPDLVAVLQLTATEEQFYQAFLQKKQTPTTTESMLAEFLHTPPIQIETLIKLSAKDPTILYLCKKPPLASFWTNLLDKNAMQLQPKLTAFELLAGRFFFQQALFKYSETNDDAASEVTALLHQAIYPYQSLQAIYFLTTIYQRNILLMIQQKIQQTEPLGNTIYDLNIAAAALVHGEAGYILLANAYFWMLKAYAHLFIGSNRDHKITEFLQLTLQSLHTAYRLAADPAQLAAIYNLFNSESNDLDITNTHSYLYWLLLAKNHRWTEIVTIIHSYASDFWPTPPANPSVTKTYTL